MSIDVLRVLRAEQAAAPATHVGRTMGQAADEIERLRTALRRYGDRTRMAWAPAELQETIDAAISESR